MREVEPKYFIFENVASMSKEDKAIITAELGVEPIMINSALVSAQQRKRLYWTNIPNVEQPEDKGLVLQDILESDIENSIDYKVPANCELKMTSVNMRCKYLGLNRTAQGYTIDFPQAKVQTVSVAHPPKAMLTYTVLT